MYEIDSPAKPEKQAPSRRNSTRKTLRHDVAGKERSARTRLSPPVSQSAKLGFAAPYRSKLKTCMALVYHIGPRHTVAITPHPIIARALSLYHPDLDVRLTGNMADYSANAQWLQQSASYIERLTPEPGRTIAQELAVAEKMVAELANGKTVSGERVHPETDPKKLRAYWARLSQFQRNEFEREMYYQKERLARAA